MVENDALSPQTADDDDVDDDDDDDGDDDEGDEDEARPPKPAAM